MGLFHNRALVGYTVAFLAGIVAARYMAPPAFLYPAALVALVFLLLVVWKKARGFLVLIALLAAMAGFMRAYPAIYPNYVYRDNATVVSVAGTVREVWKEETSRSVVRLEDAALLSNGRELKLGVQVSLPKSGVSPGDRVEVSGKLRIPEREEQRISLLEEGVGYLMDAREEGLRVIPHEGMPFQYWPQYAAGWVRGVIQELFPETHGTVTGILLGDKSRMESQVLEEFRGVGIGHVLAVSGLHVGFLTGLLMLICRLIRLRGLGRFLVVSLCLWAYCFLTGLPPSSMRATIMANCLLLAGALGKQYDLFTSLALSALVVTGLNPLELFDVGFLMSYGAVLGIGALSGALYRRLHRLPKSLAGSISVSLGAQAGVLPVSLYVFQNWYVFSLISNLLAVPVAGTATTLAFLSCMIHPVLPFLARPIAFLSEGLIMVMEAIARFLTAYLPGTVNLEGLTLWGVGCLYAMLLCISPWFGGSRRLKGWVLLALALGFLASILF